MEKIQLLDLDIALEKALEKTYSTSQTETISLFQATQRVISEDLFLTEDIPKFDRSLQDGYGVRISQKEVNISKTIYAGEPLKSVELKNKKAIKIMTGAIVPKKCQGIVPFSHGVMTQQKTIKLPKIIHQYQNIEKKGSIGKKGELFIKKGTVLNEKHLALIASTGITYIRVYKQLHIGIISTGDEITEPWQEAKPHQIYNSNGIGIYSFLKTLGVEPTYLGIIKDNQKELIEKFKESLNFDLIIFSGGVSVGEADLSVKSFQKIGLEIFVHGIANKPGKHGMFGKLRKTYVLGIPGTPISAMTTLRVFALPIIKKLYGQKKVYPNFSYGKLSCDLLFSKKRSNTLYGNLEGGVFSPMCIKSSSKNIITLAKSNSFIITQKGKETLKKGSLVKVISQSLQYSSTFRNFYS